MILRLAGAAVVGLALAGGAVGEPPRVTLEPSDNGVRVLVDGTLFTEYRTDSAGRPVLWPLIGPGGAELTRRWPLAELAAHERDDHPHHRGLWLGHQDVNGIDFWHNPGPPGRDRRRGHIVHLGFVDQQANGADAKLVVRNDWVGPDGKRVARDERVLRFVAQNRVRWIDILIDLLPAGDAVEFGDAKDGFLAVRVAGALRTTAGRGGRIVNSEGQTNHDAWGQPAAWVDYNGWIGETRVGVAMLSHPINSRPQPRWHVRPYGLFAVNPFGEDAFPPVERYRQGSVIVRPGKPLRLRYRVLLHLGDERTADIAAAYRDYAAE